MIDVTSPSGNQELIKWIKRVNIGIILLGLILVAVPTIGSWWVTRQLPIVNTVDIDNVRVVGASELCPGQPLVYAYSFHAAGSGVLVRDRVIWRVTPPRTLVYSTSRRFILSEPIDQELTEAWHIPTTYINPETDSEEVLPAADYRMIFAISSPTRSTVVDIESLQFVVREDEDCP